MIQRIKRGNDIIDVIVGNVDDIDYIHYYTMDKNNFAEGDIREKIDDNTLEVFIDSKALDDLKRGQLRCILRVREEDKHFTDGTYDKIIDSGLNCWLED